MFVRGSGIYDVVLLECLSIHHHVCWERSDHPNDTCDLVIFGLTREKWMAKEKFSSNATDAPYVDKAVVVSTRKNFRGAVISALDVNVPSFLFFCCASEVYYTNLWETSINQDVLWFKITMNKLQFKK